MRISHVQNYQNNNKYSQQTFGAWHREVYKVDKSGLYKQLTHRNNTCFFRDDSFWVLLTNFLEKKFASTSKANVYCYGCSDGSEAYTFVMQAMSKGDKFVKKFLPIKASDYDSVAIEKAKENNYKIRVREYYSIKECTGMNPTCFFSNVQCSEWDDFNANLNDEVVKNVNFSVKDIFEDYKNVEKDNSVIFARNFWPYIDVTKDRAGLFKKLYEHLNKGSLFVVGTFDTKDFPEHTGNVKQELLNAGFKETVVENVFEKR